MYLNEGTIHSGSQGKHANKSLPGVRVDERVDW